MLIPLPFPKYFITAFIFFSVIAGRQSAAQVTMEKMFNGGINRNDDISGIVTSDGNYVFLGSYDSFQPDESIHVVKLNSSGNVVFSRKFGGLSPDVANAIVQTADGGYALTGRTSSYCTGGGVYDAYLIKLDSLGMLQWSKTFGGSSYDSFESVYQTTDGGFIIAGNTYTNGGFDRDGYLVKTDSLGTPLWEKIFILGTNEDALSSVIQSADGGYICGGYTASISSGGDYDFYCVKTDTVGNVQWQRVYGDSQDNYCNKVISSGSSGYLLAGNGGFFSNASDFNLLKIDLSGNILWEKTYGGTKDDYCVSLSPTCDGGYLLGGHTFSFGGALNMYLVKTDSAGNMAWNRTFGGSDWEYANAAYQTPIGEYVIFGESISMFTNTSSMFLIKTNTACNTSCTTSSPVSSSGSTGFITTTPPAGNMDTIGITASPLTISSPVSMMTNTNCYSSSQFSMPGDTVICPGGTAILTASGLAGYLWSTGDTSASITVSPSQSTTYYLYSGCSFTDSVRVTVLNISFDLGKDSLICSGTPLTLSVNGLPSYSWSTGDTTPSITVTPSQTTTYYLTTDCAVKDSVRIFVHTTEVSLGKDTSVCSGESLQLDAGNNGSSFAWSTGETTPIVKVNHEGVYWVTIYDGLCSAGDTITIGFAACKEDIPYIPNAFSPNGDNINDVLYVRGIGSGTFTFHVFNRWGEEVFATSSTDSGWDGKEHGKNANPGMFSFLLQWENNEGKQIRYGQVLLLR